jgi:hypothetical protein
MNYEEFLKLPLDRVYEIKKILKYKIENNLPLSEEEEELKDFMLRYVEDFKLRENRSKLERCWKLKE